MKEAAMTSVPRIITAELVINNIDETLRVRVRARRKSLILMSLVSYCEFDLDMVLRLFASAAHFAPSRCTFSTSI